MAEIKEKAMNMLTYLFTGAGIITTESVEKSILFIGGCILLFLQIRLHLLKIKKEEKDIKEKNDD
ncbi:hypothetical protein CLU97_3340 [Chryseobacterium sp. 7]|uniref:hypothetical protein n=1 Tax=Chryseobacterium sp. 7 TaxID=2035214 RepID=UPI000EAC28AB|nr:hypothetical protein [Chryseobacterium sp. 7]RLJ33851.1 hypothetical protein CLU97_3340 [Chryseobacterium sp. 7]